MGGRSTLKYWLKELVEWNCHLCDEENFSKYRFVDKNKEAVSAHKILNIFTQMKTSHRQLDIGIWNLEEKVGTGDTGWHPDIN